MGEEVLAQPIPCASYTHARRHPMVLGSIGGWSPPFQLTMTQIGVLFASALVVNKSWHLWGPWFPPVLSALVALTSPVAVAWMARRVKIEGRSPVRAALGWVMLLSAPRDGSVDGRPAREPRATDLGGVRTFIGGGEGQ